MGRRLVIRHGERVTRHEIMDRVIMIGRDPGCDLFFADQKLSRRHARVEPGPDAVRLVDLGSRNGSWVNEQRVDEYLLKTGDAIRLGGLRISFEEDPAPAQIPAPPDDGEATVILPGVPSGESGGTVKLDAAGIRERESGTGGVQGHNDTLLFSKTPPGGGGDRTVVRPSEASVAQDAGTVIVQKEEMQEKEAEPEVTTTRDLPDLTKPMERSEEAPDNLEPMVAESETGEVALGPSRDQEDRGLLSKRSVTLQMALVMVSLAVTAYLLGIGIASLGMSSGAALALMLFGFLTVVGVGLGAALLSKNLLLGQWVRLFNEEEDGISSEQTINSRDEISKSAEAADEPDSEPSWDRTLGGMNLTCQIILNDNLLVTELDERAVEILETSRDEALNKHLEAVVKEQRLLDAMLGLIEAASETSPVSQRVPPVGSPAIEVVISRLGESFIVGLREL